MALAIAGLLPLSSLGQSTAPKSSFPFPVLTARLKNGLTVVRVPVKSPGLVAYFTVVRVGSRNEVEPGLTGFAHFFEHIMFKGTPRWPAGTREALLAKLGFTENAYTSDDITVYYVTGPSSGLPQLVEVEADRFRNLVYSEETFQTEAKAVLGEYHKSATDPRLKMEEELLATAFKHHPYRHTTLGFYEDIQKMPERYAYSKEFFGRWYTPDNTLVYVVGDFDDGQTLELLEKAYEPWRGAASKLDIPPEPPQPGERVVKVTWPAQTLSRHVHAWHTPAAAATTLDGPLQELLGLYLAGPTSPLYKELVLEKQLVESIDSEYRAHRNPHLLSIVATLKSESHRPAVKAAIDTAVRDLVSGKLDTKRFEACKEHLQNRFAMSLETVEQIGHRLAFYGGVLGQPDGLDAFFRNLERVKSTDLVEFTKRYLTAKNRTILTFGSTRAAAAQSAGGGAQR